MKHILTVTVLLLAWPAASQAAEIHVATTGKDSNPGSRTAPLRTIQRAADLAKPGDVVTVHEGLYRERINPPRGGESDAMRIVYQAATGEKVEVKGSEVLEGWVKVQNDTWKATVPNSIFGGFNPYSDLIRGDWFDPMKRLHHTGAVYLNGRWLAEAARLDDVLLPFGAALPPFAIHRPPSANPGLWFAEVDREKTTIWAQFKAVDPNRQLVEINVRRTVFYPDKPGRNYITVRGFTLRHAATPWAPPTAEQIGLIGTHWSKGWIIENNAISHSVCSGIALGKHGDAFDNTSANSAAGYVKTIERARAYDIPWTKENIGHHIVRNNTISDCEQTGIVGSLGAAFSTVTGNTIHDIHVRGLFGGAEMAGIKFHAAIDVEISRNHIYGTGLGLWLDWMAQGTRVSSNLFHDNGCDLFAEVDHGPFLVDNNIFLSPATLITISQGGAFVHNLIAGAIRVHAYDGRRTPFHKPHSTEIAGLHDNPTGDDRYYNNILVGRADLSQYDDARLPVWMEGNVFFKGAKPSKHEAHPQVEAERDPAIVLIEKADGFYLDAALDRGWASGPPRRLAGTKTLGKASIPNAAYERPDGTSIQLDVDYLGKKRNESSPTPGPLEALGRGPLRVAKSPLSILGKEDGRSMTER